MSTISFGGLASGLDTDSIIKALMEAERRPLERLERTKEFEEQKLDSFKAYHDKLQALNRSIDGLYLGSSVRDARVTLSSEQYVTATVTSATPGVYSVSVEQTAQVQKSVSETAYATRGEPLFDAGEIRITTGEGEDMETFTVAVTGEEVSLSDIMAAINRTGNEHGVTAAIIDSGPDEGAERYHLVLTGADSATRFTVESDTGFAVNETPLQEARQAVAHIDGIRVTSRTNTITDAINGVSLNIEGVTPPDGNPTTLTVEADNEALVEKVEGFVNAYNDIVAYINGTGPEEDREDGAGLLRGDALVTTVTRRLHSLMSTRVTDSGTFDALSQLGLSTNRDGTVSFSKPAMEAALKEDYEQVVDLLAGDSGVFKDYRSYLNNITSSREGVYASREQSTRAVIKRLDMDIERMETRLERREEFLSLRFTAMEQMVNMFNAQSEYLSNQMDRMPVIGGKK